MPEDTITTVKNFPEILTSCRFFLRIENLPEPVDAFFMDLKGVKRSQEVVEICEVTPQRWGNATSGQVIRTKIPGNVKNNNLTLRRGITQSQNLWKWFESVQQGNWKQQRRSGSLSIFDQEATERVRFSFQRAWPVSYVISDLGAGSNEIEIEELELAVEELIREEVSS